MRAFLTLLLASWRYAKGRRGIMVLYFGMFVCSNILNLVEPYVIGKLLNMAGTPYFGHTLDKFPSKIWVNPAASLLT